MRQADNGLAGQLSVEVREVHKSFKGVAALRGVSLSVRPNEFVTLLGPSGCGKTTLLRLVGGFMEPDRGSISVGGRVVGTAKSRHRLTRMVFQQYALFPHMTVGENVAFGLRMRGMNRADRDRRVRAVLESVRLPDKTDAKPAQLSGGQQQRVALARAIVTDPAVLLLDEPLAALDLQLRKNMQLELKSLHRSLGITFIYVTHDQGEALTMSDRIAVMSNGRIEQVGAGAHVYDHPASRFVAGFIGEANILEGRVVSSGDGRVLVDIDGAKISLPDAPGNGLRAGQSVTFMIRPEKISVPAPPAAASSLAGTVTERVHLGALQRMLLAVGGGGRQIMIDGINLGSASVGEQVRIYWSDDAVRWLR